MIESCRPSVYLSCSFMQIKSIGFPHGRELKLSTTEVPFLSGLMASAELLRFFQVHPLMDLANIGINFAPSFIGRENVGLARIFLASLRLSCTNSNWGARKHKFCKREFLVRIQLQTLTGKELIVKSAMKD